MNKYFGSVNDDNISYFLFDYLTKYTNQNKQNLCFIAPDIKTENKILTDLKFYFYKNKALSGVKLLNFPSYETLFYDISSASANVISRRINTINQLLNNKNQFITVTSLETILFKLPPKNFFAKFSLNLAVGDILDITEFANSLVDSGYLRVNRVADKLEFAIRGSIIDIYPAGAKNPIRIDLFDDEINEIRIFDLENQLSIKELKKINIASAKEFSFDKDSRAKFLNNYKKNISAEGIVYQKVKDAIIPAGIEYYLPLFFDSMSSFFDFAIDSTEFIYQDGLSSIIDKIWQQINGAYANNSKKSPLKPEHLFWQKNEFFNQLNQFNNVVLSNYKDDKKVNFLATKLPLLKIQNKSLKLLRDFLSKTNNKVILVCSTRSRVAIFLDLLTEFKLAEVNSFCEFLTSKSQFCITTAILNSGINTKEITIINEEAVFGNILSTQRSKRRAKHKDFKEGIKNLIEININDFIVHENYGIGRYLGIKTLDIDNIKQDLVHLEYQDSAKLLIPIDEIGLISKYIGGNNPSLNKLGTAKWSNAKTKVLKEMFDIASELLVIYAKRELAGGCKINSNNTEYDKFVANFSFVETEDQIKAINQVIEDLADDSPMDRLICGDVGFGKTEVAMRAAFLAVLSNFQVMILTPTTLLASQHYKSFVERFSSFAVNIAELSRFKTQKQQNQIKKDLITGKIDIVIGTHKLLQQDIKYKNLGLIVIDEEHRFGVRQKEQLKQIKSKCNILSMSATPIPRTLNLVLNDLRKMSVIATPPIGRNKIKTFVKEFSNSVITEAVQREIHRGGQIFFVHNDIDSIDRVADDLRDMFPRINIRVAHGRMNSLELERIMSDFYHGYFEILICTTIIETGIDIPTANTIIINDAVNFGLSQLHQLRGRVGRSSHKAYAYLLVKSIHSITSDAKKRLEAISNLEEVGSGFSLANHDLEIRGAGDILGKNQSGKISEIGYALYYDLLQKTIKSIQQNKDIKDLNQDKVEINLGVSCIIPSHYVFDVHERLEFYAKIKNNDIDEVKFELIDRYGLLPDETKNLFAREYLAKLCEDIGITTINAFNDRVLISFSLNAKVNFAKIIQLIQNKPTEYKLKDNSTLIYFYQDLENLARITKIKQIIADFRQ